MGRACSKIIIQFNNREYFYEGGVKQVLSVEKLGQW